LEDIHSRANGQQTAVELWVHIPEGTGNIDVKKWTELIDGLLLVRSKWTWPIEGGRPTRTTWDPTAEEYAEDGKAAGLDTVFNSRLPRPFRIGSLDNPEEEHKKLLEIVLEPIKNRLAELMKDESSDLRAKVKALQIEAEKPVSTFKADLDKVQTRVNSSYRRVFSTSEIRLSITLGDLAIDPSASLVKASHVGITDSYGQTKWSQQGTGSQRALFWSMLEVRSELNRIAEERKASEKTFKKKEEELSKAKSKRAKATKASDIATQDAAILQLQNDINGLGISENSETSTGSTEFLPGYMLLIDEPETALHPAAIRAAKDHLYSLAAGAGWQVMLSTHHPAFVDPLKDHTTIVRLHRADTHAAPNVYRADSMKFCPEDPESENAAKQTLKTLLAFDQSVAEMFFAHKVIVVEGDTEFAAFTVAMDKDGTAFPVDGRPLILRARGKWTIPVLVRMLCHFKVNFAVLHDVDSPKSSGGARVNGAYTANHGITAAINAARTAGIHVIHRCSVPDFERQHGMDLPTKDKPFEAWKEVNNNPIVLASVRAVLNELTGIPNATAGTHIDDGKHFESNCKHWASTNAVADPAYAFI
jgi:putative ATP-dependent endonuclease of OLD family